MDSTHPDTQGQFDLAAAAFQRHIRHAANRSLPEPPDLGDARYDRILDVHAAALAAVLDDVADRAMPVRDDPLERVQDHEERYWITSVQGSDLPDPHLERMRIVVAVATLCGADDDEAARRVLGCLRTFNPLGADGVDRYHAWQRAMYPGNAALNPLRPDRLGEDLVVTVLKDNTGITVRLAEHVDDSQLTRALTVLARAAQRHDSVHRPMSELLSNDSAHRIGIGFIIASQTESDQLAAVLADLTTADSSVAEVVVGDLPDKSLVLSVLAATLTEALLRAELSRDPLDIGMVAEIRHNLAHRRADVGDYDGALTAAGEAVAAYRQLAAGSADGHVELALALDTLSAAYARLGMYESGHEYATESIELLESVVEQLGPELTFSSSELTLYLSTVTTNAGGVLIDVGDTANGLALVERGLSLARELAASEVDNRSAEVATRYADGLVSLGAAYASCRQHHDALETTLEAVEAWRAIDAVSPDQYRTDLIRALGNCAGMHTQLGHWDEGRAQGLEAVSLARSLVTRYGRVHEVQLAEALNNTAAVLRRLKRTDEALAHATEAVALYRRLATEQPGTQLEALAAALHNLANALEETGSDQALDTYEEAADIYRKIIDPRPGVFEADLADVLVGLANAASDAGEHELARDWAIEAVNLFAQAAHASSRSMREKLASALHMAAIAAFDLGDVREAVRDSTRASEIYRELALNAPFDYELTVDRVKALHSCGRALDAHENHEQAASAFAEAITALRELLVHPRARADQARDERQDELAGLLVNAGVCATNRGRHDEAVDLVRDAVAIRRALLDPGSESRAYLAEALNNLADSLCDIGNFSEAVAAAREALDLARRLLDEEPEETDAADSATSIVVYAMTTYARAIHPENADDAMSILVEAMQLAVSAEDDSLEDPVVETLRLIGGPSREQRRLWKSMTDIGYPL